MKFVSWFVVVLLSSVIFIVVEEVVDQFVEIGFVFFEFWEEFVVFHYQSGEIGIWEMCGKIVVMWEGIPVGFDYIVRYGVQLVHDGQVVIYIYYMVIVIG